MSRTHGFAIATYAATTALSVGLLFSPGLTGVSPAQTGGNQSPQQLAAQAQAGLAKAASVRVGYVDRSATAVSGSRMPTSMNLALDRRGNCAGTLTLGGHGGSVEIIKRGPDVWLKPDAVFWKAAIPGRRGVAAAASFGNRYIHGSTAGTLLSGIAGTCDLGTLQKAAMVTVPASLTEGLATMVNGTRVVPLTFRVNRLTSTLYVTPGKPHHLYRAAQRGPGTNLSLTFTDYNKPVRATPPPASRTVDISKVPNMR
ncbi:hypothetical protein ABT173_17760 [Streptomyces sp. NPDC001795]|uniref:hypothetical protein n=1 Tax=unclassified Streptomyces TaxID=2593676 RepID=UPI003327DAE3